MLAVKRPRRISCLAAVVLTVVLVSSLGGALLLSFTTVPPRPVRSGTGAGLYPAGVGEGTPLQIPGRAQNATPSGAENSVVATTAVGVYPSTGVYDAANGELYVPNYGSENVSVIDTTNHTVVATIAVGVQPTEVVYDPANGDVYVVSTSSGNVSVISGATNTVVASVAVGSWPESATLDGGDGDLYVSNDISSTVSVISTANNTVVATIPVGASPTRPAYDAANGDLYVTDATSGNLSVISGSTNSVVATIPLGQSPTGATYDPANGQIYVVCLPNLIVISGANNTIAATTPLPGGFSAPTYDPSNGDLYISGQPIVVVSGATSRVLGTIAGGPAQGSQPTYDAANGELYLGSTSTPGRVAIVSGWTNSLLEMVSVGSGPMQPAVDPANGEVYVCNYASGNVSILAGGFTVNWTESGLPSGTEWGVNLSDGSSVNSTTPTVSYAEPNGSYSYTVGTADTRYAARGGAFSVGGHAVSQAVTFSLETFAVTMAESGLPPGTSWEVNVSGQLPQRTTSSNISLRLANGSYSYAATSANSSYASAGGTFSVKGATAVTVRFARVTFRITFNETGLPQGTEWWVNLSGGLTGHSTNASLTVEVPNGSYDYAIASANTSYFASGASVTVAGAPLDLPVAFSWFTYPVVATESGLAAGLSWTVSVQGIRLNLTTDGLTDVLHFPRLPNGSYAYSIGALSGWLQGTVPYHGLLTVDGGPPRIDVTYHEVVYGVWVVETGLANGTPWSVTLNGTTYSNGGTSVSLSAPNGSYPFVVATVAGYVARPPGGVVGVVGQNVTVTISFSPSGGATLLGLPAAEGYAVVIGTVVVAVAAVAVVLARRGRPRPPEGLATARVPADEAAPRN